MRVTTGSKSEPAGYLDKRWLDDGGAFRVLKPGTTLFHGGLAQSVDEFNKPTSTWFATGSRAKQHALEYAKLAGLVKKEQTYLLVCSLRSPLNCAHFMSSDFTDFIHEYFRSQALCMPPALHEWGQSQEDLDGIYFDCERPEVALFQPNSALLQQVSCEPVSKD